MPWGQLKDRAALPHSGIREGRARCRWQLWLSAQSCTPQALPGSSSPGAAQTLRVHPLAAPLSLGSPAGTRERGQHTGGQWPLRGWEVSHKEASALEGIPMGFLELQLGLLE